MTPLTGPGSKPAWRSSSWSAAIEGGGAEGGASLLGLILLCAWPSTTIAAISHKAIKIRVYIATAPEIIRVLRFSYGARAPGHQPGGETMAEPIPGWGL